MFVNIGYISVSLFLSLNLADGRNVVTRQIYEINEDVQETQLIYGDVIRPEEGYQPNWSDDENEDEIGDQLDEAFDWIQTPMRAIVKNRGTNRWANNEVPYELSRAYSANERSQIESAIRDLQSITCFKFPKKSKKHRDYIYIDKKDGCYSYVGKYGGRQLVSLGNGCLTKGTVQHELMHAMGIEHEHQRPDRDQYIKVKFENVESNMKSNFDKIPYKQVDLHGLKYDYNSVMHYDGQAFGKSSNGRKLDTMVPLQSGIKLIDNPSLSSQDIKKLQILGNCGRGGDRSKGRKKTPKSKRGGRRRGRTGRRRRVMEPIYE